MAKWGDLLEDEEELPPSTTTGPDAKGVVTKVEYYRNEKGEVMKKTTKTRVVKIEKKVYKVRPGGGRRAAGGGGAHRPTIACALPGVMMPAGCCTPCVCGRAAASCPANSDPSRRTPSNHRVAAGGPGPSCRLEEVWRGSHRACGRQRDQPDTRRGASGAHPAPEADAGGEGGQGKLGQLGRVLPMLPLCWDCR